MNDLVKYSDFLEKRDKLRRPAPKDYADVASISFEEICPIFSSFFVNGCPECHKEDGRKHPMKFNLDSWNSDTFNVEMRCPKCERKAKAAVIKNQIYRDVSKDQAKKNLKEFAQFIFENFGDICEIEGKRKEIT